MVFPNFSNIQRRSIDNYLLTADYDSFVLAYQKLYEEPKKRLSSWYIDDTYNLACVYTAKRQYDTAIGTLLYLAKRYLYKNIYVLGDVDLEPLHYHKLWVSFDSIVVINFSKSYKQAQDVGLLVKLMRMEALDQSMLSSRNQDIRKRYPSVNHDLVKVLDSIIEQFGYPKPDLVGEHAAKIPALIIAHASLQVQLRYKDLLMSEGLKGNIPGGTAGIVIDKILIKQGKKQLYGTQGYYDKTIKKNVPYPVEDIAQIDARRKQMGFVLPWADYIKLQNNFQNNN